MVGGVSRVAYDSLDDLRAEIERLGPERVAAGIAVPAVFEAARAQGVITRPLGTSLGISPPLTIDAEQIALIPAAIAAGIEAVAAG